ncbi:MAG: hypothetical protein R3C60_14945 [Parvularculaceae bacterium]
MLAAINQRLPRRRQCYQCILKGVAGFTGRGVFRYAEWSNGSVSYEIDLKGLAGLKAEFAVNGEPLIGLPLNEGVCWLQFDTAKGATPLRLNLGDEIVIGQNGRDVLGGHIVPINGLRAALRRSFRAFRRRIAVGDIQSSASVHQSQ